jgi:hypothetical protein
LGAKQRKVLEKAAENLLPKPCDKCGGAKESNAEEHCAWKLERYWKRIAHIERKSGDHLMKKAFRWHSSGKMNKGGRDRNIEEWRKKRQGPHQDSPWKKAGTD